jgi:hypothetical protein
MFRNMLTFCPSMNSRNDWRQQMKPSSKQARVYAGWIYVPGALMILLGASIFLFPRFFPSIVAGCFILAGLMLIQSMRRLRKAAISIRTQLDVEGEQMPELSLAGPPVRRVYTSYVN